MAPPPTRLEATCPRCFGTDGQWLEFTSRIHEVDYYQCRACAHVWTAPKPAQTRASAGGHERREPAADAPQRQFTSIQRPVLLPPCPECHRIDRVQLVDQSGSETEWFTCDRCGTCYRQPPRR